MLRMRAYNLLLFVLLSFCVRVSVCVCVCAHTNVCV